MYPKQTKLLIYIYSLYQKSGRSFWIQRLLQYSIVDFPHGIQTVSVLVLEMVQANVSMWCCL